MGDIRQKLILLAFLLVLAGVISFLSSMSILPSPFKMFLHPTHSDLIRSGTIPPPPMTPATREKLEKSHGFQALVSYTDEGFEPREVTIKKGQTIRFTNNSSRDLWVAASADTSDSLYPAVVNGCGSSAFDSCGPIAPQDFWEFTFDSAGAWTFVNNLDKAKSGVAHVTVYGDSQ